MLADIKVVEFSQNAAVPQAGRLLAGMGADVIKVEPPTGDAMRSLGTIAPGESRAYAVINPGKRSICLDLGSDDSAPVVERLIEWADIVLVGMKRTDIARYGLDWDRVHSLNPRAVSLEFTAYGPAGPQADEGGYDPLVQAASGLGWTMNRSADGVPLATRPAFVDFSSGAVATVGILAALRDRDRTGVGQRVDASLLGSALSLGTAMMYSFDHDAANTAELREEIDLLRQAGTDFETQRSHYEQRIAGLGGLFRIYVRPYRSADGVISIAGYSPILRDRLHDLTGLDRVDPGMAPDDPAVTAVVEAAEAMFAAHTTSEWIERLATIGYPCARYNTPVEAIEGDQVELNGYVTDLEHPVFGGYRTIAMPFSFSDSPVGLTRPSPTLGQHSAEVLDELGL